MAKQSLGKGFAALIPQDFDSSLLTEDQERVQKLLIRDVVPNPDQPRSSFNEQLLDELAHSIKQHGVLQPIIVVRHGKDGNYRIVAGERRWRAARVAGLEHIPAIVRSFEELEQLEIALIENIQREDLSPLEQAVAIYRLQQQFNMGLEEIAKKLGKATSTVSNTTRLLQLPEDARKSLADKKISEGHARAILALKDVQQQEHLLHLIITNNWTVRQAEQFVVAAKQGAKDTIAIKSTAKQTPLTKKISKKIHAPVTVKRTAKGGQLIISFTNDDDLNRIATLINK